METSANDPEKQFEDQARENREKFLKPYFERYKKLRAEALPKESKEPRKGKEAKKETFRQKKVEKKIAALIGELIKLEPSHLAEPWILWEVIGWMNRRDCKVFLQAAIMDEKGRNRRTKKQQKKLALDFFFIQKVDRLRKKRGCSIEKTCEILAESIKGQEDPAGNLIKRYYKQRNAYRQMCEQRDETRKVMPFPYYGRDYRPYP